jgi:sugar phosphate isomerase/epimerase
VSTAPVSVQLYTVREALAADPAATFARLADIGFRSVELFGFVDRAEQFVELLSGAGLDAPSGHASLVDQDVVPVFEAARALGMTTVIDPFTDPARWTTGDDIAAIAAELNRVAAIGADLGITVGYHNHQFELEAEVDGTTGLEVLADLLDPSVVLELDTYWAAVGGADPVALLGRLGDRVQLIHVKDGDISMNTRNQAAAGEGRMPVLDILAAAPTARRVVEFDDFDGDMFEAVGRSAAYLVANGEQL